MDITWVTLRSVARPDILIPIFGKIGKLQIEITAVLDNTAVYCMLGDRKRVKFLKNQNDILVIKETIKYGNSI